MLMVDDCYNQSHPVVEGLIPAGYLIGSAPLTVTVTHLGYELSFFLNFCSIYRQTTVLSCCSMRVYREKTFPFLYIYPPRCVWVCSHGNWRRDEIADKCTKLCPLQDLRYQGPKPKHQLGGARRWRGTSLQWDVRLFWCRSWRNLPANVPEFGCKNVFLQQWQ